MAKEAKFSHEGMHIDYTPSGADVAAGQVVELGTNAMIGIADNDIADGELGALTVRGAYWMAKTTGTFAVGDKVYWDDGSNIVSATSTGNPPIGFVIAAAASGDAYVLVLVQPGG